MHLLAPSLPCLVLFEFFYIVKLLYAVQVTGAVEVVLAVRSLIYVCCLMQQSSACSFSSASGVYVCPSLSSGLGSFLPCVLSPFGFLFSLVLS